MDVVEKDEVEVGLLEMRRDDMLKIEEQIGDLAEVQQILSEEVRRQDEGVEELGENIEEAVEYVKKGKEELEEADDYKSRWRRRWALAAGAVTGVLFAAGTMLVIVNKR